jgi:uncharacterized UPF0146 family protein
MTFAKDLLDRTEKAIQQLRKERDTLFLSVESIAYIEHELKYLLRSKAELSNYLVELQKQNNKDNDTE